MTGHAPSIAIAFDKRGSRIERIAAFGAKEVASVPFAAARENDFAFDGGLAASAAGGEEFVVVEVAVEAGGGVLVG